MVKSSSSGLTLIEVLIALAIVSIALTAIIKSVSQNIRATDYLQNKTIALYVGKQVMNEILVGVQSDEKITMLGANWYWRAETASTPNEHIKKIIVSVFKQAPSENSVPILRLVGYQYDEA